MKWQNIDIFRRNFAKANGKMIAIAEISPK
jgi:hypothetical protein